MDLKKNIISSLKKFDVGDEFSHLPNLPKDSKAKASVLIPLFIKEGTLHVLLTVRSTELKHNAGEVCFPGGKSDPGDKNEIDTALREAEEEICLTPDGVEVVCRLCPVINQRGLVVTPVVGFISGTFQACPNPDEVSEVFSVPLEFFMKEADHSAYPVPNIGFLTHSFIFTDPATDKIHQIWGLTAFLILQLAVLIFQKKPEFEVDFDVENPIAASRRYLLHRLSKL